MTQRTDESIKTKLRQLQTEDLALIQLTTMPGLTFAETMEIGAKREKVGMDIAHELRLWTRRGYTIDDLFKDVNDP